jgi:heme-degrading monooxygenase HmoA
MFARNISIHLKPNVLADFTQTFEKEVVPVLRKQKGFQDEITFSTPGGSEVIAISLWDSEENAEAYNSTGYSEVLRILAKVIDGTPKVHVSEVIHSTFHKIAAGAAPGPIPVSAATAGVPKAVATV